LDRTGCATLDFFDWWGNGIALPGGIMLTYNGTVFLDHSNTIGGGMAFHIGDGC
jgi:hypothetical protein